MGNVKHDDKMNHHDKMNHPKSDKMAKMSKEKHVMMKGGKVILMRKNGTKRTIINYTELNNGTRVMANGNITKKDGSQRMLQEGEAINMAGDIVYYEN
jgi:hypothetical protein